MTTVAYDGRFLSADGRATNGNLISGKSTQKIFPLETTAAGCAVKGVLAGAGSYQAIMQVKTHLESNDLFDAELIPEVEVGEFSALLILETGEAYVLEHKLIPMPCECPVAIGSGTDFAMAAMTMGKAAPASVEVACTLDCFSGGTIRTFDTKAWSFVKGGDE